MSDEDNPRSFVRCTLPWIAGAGAVVVFLLTLNQWVNLKSLPVAAKIAGWEWGLPVQMPLLQVASFPIRFISPAWQPVALNMFTAFCAALTLVLLARSVALLPHDRTHEQRVRERSDYSLLSGGLSWVPILLAVGACAFQLTFWEHATAMTGEMFDLLLFAYVTRCLLEYRISMEEGWLSKMALVYGLGVTNNWALIGFFPLFLGAIIWIRGIRFFEPAFLVRMAVLGVAGLLLYLLLPVIWVVKREGDYSLLQVLRANLASQKMFLLDTPPLRNRVLLLSLTSILPVVLMGIRWPSRSGETSAAGANLSTLAFRIIHLFILAACLFVVFDPKFSPRELGLGVPFLTFYYLGALAIGYYSGYALLVFTEPARKSWRRENPLGKLFNPLVRAAVLLAAAAVPAALIYKNLPFVRAADGSVLREFVANTVEGLPKGPAYLLSEDAYQLALLQGQLAGAGRASDYVLLNTRSLELPDYYEQVHRRYGDRWPLLAAREELGIRLASTDIQRVIFRLAQTNTVVYLHPSFGYFFEVLYAHPSGPVYSLHPFAPDQVLPPPPSDETMRANVTYWIGNAGLLDRIEKLRAHNPVEARYIAQFYSRALNAWGVQNQRLGKLPEAGKLFAQAYALNTNNIPAKFNAEFNQAFQSGATAAPSTGRTLDEKFGTYRSWDTMLQDNGSFDHPEFCALLGDGFLNQNQFRQAALQFSRTVFFEPDNLGARVALGKAYVYGNWVDQGMALIEKMEQDFKDRPPNEKAEITALKAAAFYTRNQFAQAEDLLQSARRAHPEVGALNQALFELYRVSGRFTNALEVLNQQLQKTPTNVVVLLQKAELQLNQEDLPGAQGTVEQVLALAPRSSAALLFQAFVFIRAGNFAQAQSSLERILQQDPDNLQALLYKGIVLMEQKEFEKSREAFNRVLEKQPDNVAALRNRAVLHLRAQHWGEAREDYEQLRKLTPRSHAVMYGLAEIAYARKDFIEATRFYENYLRYAPAEATGELLEEKRKVEERLRELKSVGK